ncbi:unnamed protein product, partial [Polarella glacialis]
AAKKRSRFGRPTSSLVTRILLVLLVVAGAIRATAARSWGFLGPPKASRDGRGCRIGMAASADFADAEVLPGAARRSVTLDRSDLPVRPRELVASSGAEERKLRSAIESIIRDQ